MSETKFTKGEWWVNNTGKHYNNQDIDNLQICYSLAEECICDTVYELSDAHLIAAAPEMYRLLVKAKSEINYLDEMVYDAKGGGSFKPSEILDEIEKLLAKARGET